MSETSLERLLDAAVEQFTLTGVRRTSADDIARRAGVNRATLYRRLGTKDEIVAQAVLRETGRVLEQITSRLRPIPDPGDGPFDVVADIDHFFTVTITEVRTNQLVQELMARDPLDTLVGLTARAGDIIALAGDLCAERIAALRRHVGNPRTSDIPAVGHTLARLTQSLLLTPDGPPDLDDAAARRAYVDAVIAPLVLQSPLPNH